MPSTVGLIGGTGKLGPGLALRFALAGLPVLIGSRDAAKGAAAAAEVATRLAEHGGGAAVTGHANIEAAARCEVAVLTIPHDGQPALLPQLAESLSGKVVVSTAVPVTVDPNMGPGWDWSLPDGAAAEVARLLPASRIAAAFHSLSSWVLARPQRGVDSHVVVTADDAEAKRVTMQLAELLPGVRAVDGGPLRYACDSEHVTVLLMSINRIHRRHTGIIITDLPDPPG